MGRSFRLTAKVLLHAASHRQDTAFDTADEEIANNFIWLFLSKIRCAYKVLSERQTNTYKIKFISFWAFWL